MFILTLRTDKPDAEIGLYDDQRQIAYECWPAHRQLAETIHLKIKTSLANNNLTPQQLNGIAVYTGPGSFTGLRIGIAVANATAAGYGVPVVGKVGEGWLIECLDQLLAGDNDNIVVPEYGATPNITAPRK